MTDDSSLGAPRRFPAKAILFGEYSVILGGKALAMPLQKFSGRFEFSKNKMPAPLRARQQMLPELARSAAIRAAGLDASAFALDLQKGLFFRSDIPHGYGLGSSGAVTAAVFDRYSTDRSSLSLDALKERLGQIEAFFHGRSSGLDPLVSCLQRPVLAQAASVEALDRLELQPAGLRFFLLDTGQPRSAKPIIEWFSQKAARDAAFKKDLEAELLPANEAAISALLAEDGPALWAAFSRVAAFQIERFGPMLPGSQGQWAAAALRSDFERLKICGAGGGGFLLGLSADPARTETERPEQRALWL